MCSIEGCDKKIKTRGWCSAHYERWRRNGDPGVAGDARKHPRVECSIDGCERFVKSRGMCEKHYGQWRTTGNPLPLKRPNYGTGRVVTPDGYVLIWDPTHPLANSTGYVMEHRKIMWDAGLLTDPGMQVHHKNHNRSDNRVENLTTMTARDHSRHHAESAGVVRNQYGEFPVKPRGERRQSGAW